VRPVSGGPPIDRRDAYPIIGRRPIGGLVTPAPMFLSMGGCIKIAARPDRGNDAVHTLVGHRAM